jgi:hypothetical protein
MGSATEQMGMGAATAADADGNSDRAEGAAGTGDEQGDEAVTEADGDGGGDGR